MRKNSHSPSLEISRQWYSVSTPQQGAPLVSSLLLLCSLEDEISKRTGPERLGFGDDQSDVLRALLHLASQVQRRGNDEKGVRPSDFHLAVEALHVDLGRGHGLLSDAEPLAETVELCRSRGSAPVHLGGPRNGTGGYNLRWLK